MSKALIQKHQVMMDTAIQYTGAAEALFDIALLNGYSISDEVNPGTLLFVPEVLDSKVLKFFTQGKYKPVTVIPVDDALTGEGIEFWAVEYDFIVR